MEQKPSSLAELHTLNNCLLTQMIHEPFQILKSVEIMFFATGTNIQNCHPHTGK